MNDQKYIFDIYYMYCFFFLNTKKHYHYTDENKNGFVTIQSLWG